MKTKFSPSLPFPSAPWNATRYILVIYSSMLFLTNCEEACDSDNSHIGVFFCFVILNQSLFIGKEDNVACLSAAQGQGPGIMEVHCKCRIPWCISVGLLTLSTVHASTVRNSKVKTSQWMPCRNRSFSVPSFTSSVRNWLEEESTPQTVEGHQMHAADRWLIGDQMHLPKHFNFFFLLF